MGFADSPWLLTTAALAFAIVNGTNDGSTLLSLGIRVPGLPLLWAVALLVVSVTFTPLLGTAVAETFLNRLVTFDDQIAQATLVAVVSALLVVLLLGRKGVPTSLTVATLGGLVGSGVGQTMDVQWRMVTIVLGVALVTPAIGAIVAVLMNRVAEGVRVRGGAS